MMRWVESVDAEDFFAGAGKVIEGGAAVGSQADYDDIVRFGDIQRWGVTMLFGLRFLLFGRRLPLDFFDKGKGDFHQ
jgi:hypothetical protein